MYGKTLSSPYQVDVFAPLGMKARRAQMNKILLDARIAELGMDEFVFRIFEALGGKANVIAVDSCMTRLRTTLQNRSDFSTEKLTVLGAFAVFDMGDQLHIMFGLESYQIMKVMEKLI